MIMMLWNKRRQISEKLEGKILPAVLTMLKARTRGLGNLTVVKAAGLQRYMTLPAHIIDML